MSCVEYEIDMSACQADDNTKIDFLEHVDLHMKIQHTRRGNIMINVTGPSGTPSTLLFPRKHDTSKDGIPFDFGFSSIHFWGESVDGKWTVKVCDMLPSGTAGTGTIEK